MRRNKSKHQPDIVCLHCGSLAQNRGTCCVCSGTRKITFEKAMIECTNVWARAKCKCDTCVYLRKTFPEFHSSETKLREPVGQVQVCKT